MRRVLGWLVVALAAGGCRQLFGIDDTQVEAIDARADGAHGVDFDAAIIDAPPGLPDAIPPDARACASLYPMSFGGHRYTLVNNQKNWTNAEAGCAADGGYLVIPDDQAEDDFVAGLNAGQLWIGVTDQVNDGQFVTVHGETIPPHYVNWDTSVPNGGTVENCVQIYTSSGQSDGAWDDSDCPNNRRSLCECDL